MEVRREGREREKWREGRESWRRLGYHSGSLGSQHLGGDPEGRRIKEFKMSGMDA